MAVDFQRISRLEELTDAIDRSHESVVVLFNHDPWCPISARAYREVETTSGVVHIIDVSREREITRELASRTGVRHESPQVIVLRDGDAIWSASHFRVTADEISRVMGVTTTQDAQ